MKKIGYLSIGLISGMLLTLSFSAAAEEVQNLIGKTVESQVSVNIDGKDLDTSGIIVDGSSFAPVRAIGEAAGLNVDFQDNKVILTKKVSDKAKIYQERAKQREELQKQVDAIRTEMAPIAEQYDVIRSTPLNQQKLSMEEMKQIQKKYDDYIAKLEELYKQINETYNVN